MGFVWLYYGIMPVTLYKRQRALLEYIGQYMAKHGFSPTLTELAGAMGVSSVATIHEHIQNLEKKGVIKKWDGVIRGIEILDKTVLGNVASAVDLPMLGFIAAGQPIEPVTDQNMTVSISPSMISGKKRAFVLKVKGESMIEDGILDGDYVVIEQQEEAHNGDIVVALLETGMATLKRFFREADRIRLEPANAKMSPIYATNVKIQGKVVGVIRKYNSM